MSRNEITIEVCEGVYAPSDDSYLLLDRVECGERVLEIGSGSGIISIACALDGSEVDAVDINERAVQCTLNNSGLNGVRVNAYQSDLFTSVPGGITFDTIIFNPPYLPTEDNIEGSEQWDGGADGFRLVRPFLVEAVPRLKEGGQIYMILSSLTDIESLKKEFRELKFDLLDERSFFFEKIFVLRITS